MIVKYQTSKGLGQSEVVKMNNKTVWVKLVDYEDPKDGMGYVIIKDERIIKRHKKKHHVEISG